MGTINGIGAGTGSVSRIFTGGVVVGTGVCLSVGVGSGVRLIDDVRVITSCRIVAVVLVALDVAFP